MTTERDPYEGARGNAKGHFDDILESYRQFLARHEDSDSDGGEAIEERERERALSVLVRSGWHEPGNTDHGDCEYEILLTTGGPALRVWGELDGYGGPADAQLQMQDWGVPWREVWPCEVEQMNEAREALLWFADLFYFGE